MAAKDNTDATVDAPVDTPVEAPVEIPTVDTPDVTPVEPTQPGIRHGYDQNTGAFTV
jgi:hypothetical protein